MDKNQKESSLKLVWIFLSLNLLVSCVAIGLYFTRPSKAIVYVDSIKLMNGYKGMKDARKAYEEKTSIWKINLDSLKTELQDRIKDYQNKQGKLSQKEKQLTEELLNTKQHELLNYQQVVSEKMEKEDQELTTNVLNRVNEYIKDYGEAHGYDIILAATQYGNIVYSKNTLDITDNILAGLNKQYAN